MLASLSYLVPPRCLISLPCCFWSTVAMRLPLPPLPDHSLVIPLCSPFTACLLAVFRFCHLPHLLGGSGREQGGAVGAAWRAGEASGLWQRVAGREGGGMTHGRQSQRPSLARHSTLVWLHTQPHSDYRAAPNHRIESSGAEDKGEETEEEKRKQGRKRGSRGGEEEAEEERKQRRRRGSRGGGEEAEEEKRLLLQTCCRSVSSFGDGGGPTSGAAEPSSRGIDGSGGMDGSNGMRRTSGTAKSDKADHPLFMVRLPSQPPSPLPRGSDASLSIPFSCCFLLFVPPSLLYVSHAFNSASLFLYAFRCLFHIPFPLVFPPSDATKLVHTEE
ncbi:unnamed protein product [Closterium sp. NIES-65]|nr:unnamed protein product [Closterium sp. NIES-65]